MHEYLHVPMYSCTYSGNRYVYNYSDKRNSTIGLLKIETELKWIDRHRNAKIEIELIMHVTPRAFRKV